MAAPLLQHQIERRRRRRLRLLPIIGYAIAVLGLAYFFEQRPSTTILFVRHTDTDATVAEDPPLSERGRQRAEMLADFLQDVDVVAGVNAIFVGHNKRTEQTAAVLAARLNVSMEARDQDNVVSYIGYVMRHHIGEIVLVAFPEAASRLLTPAMVSAANQVERFDAEGAIVSVDPGKHLMTIDHGDIKGLMSPMTMTFPVQSPALFIGVTSGDRVQFTLERSPQGLALIALTKQETPGAVQVVLDIEGMT